MIVCWAMGLTQHKNAVATIREIASFLLLRGNIGRPGAGAAPIRGHSNVQGDRTMGIWEQMPDAFLDAVRDEFGFEPPREHGTDTVAALRAMRDGEVDVFVGLGGNFAVATPDTAVATRAMENVGLTVGIQTKLNRSHLHHGREALILPCLGRTERDITPAGEQFVTVEDSMSMVHSSRGKLLPGSPHLRSEVQIVCGIGHALFGGESAAGTGHAEIDWPAMATDYSLIRRHISHVVDGFHAFEERVGHPGGFQLPNAARDSQEFETDTGKARITANPLTAVEVPEGHLLLQTLRSHDQFNTTVYGYDDRYRGIKHGRSVVFVNPADVTALGLADGDTVDVVSVADDGERRLGGCGWSPTRRRGDVSPPTTRRPTCSCRWTPPPTSRTPRSRSRSWSGWSASPRRPDAPPACARATRWPKTRTFVTLAPMLTRSPPRCWEKQDS
ncbi:MAG: molybdopterin dinucleotide binding domain-containing protein [Nocardioides sp.]